MNAKQVIVGALVLIGFVLVVISIYGNIMHDKELAEYGLWTGIVMMVLVAMYWPKAEKKHCDGCQCEEKPAKEKKC